VIAFVDNDIIVKLAALDLCDEAFRALGLRDGDIQVLPTAKFRLYVAKNREKGILRWGAETHGRIRAFLSQVGETPGSPDRDDEQSLANILGVDAGEAILFSAASRIPDSRMVTGDKRSIAALASEPKCKELVQKLAGRVVCLEQVVRDTIDKLGFATVLPRVTPGIHQDNTLGIVFSSGILTPETHVRDGLQSYIEDLRKDSGGMLRRG
jgi:hypothetical protein